MSNECKVGISARHVHLSKKDSEILFGAAYEFTPKPGVDTGGQYPVMERVEVIGPKSSFAGVGILFPLRRETQVEISKTDSLALGIHAPIRMSGDLENSAGGLTLRGPAGELKLERGVIVAKRHIHVDQNFLQENDLTNGRTVKLEVRSEQRSLVFDDVLIKLDPGDYGAVAHIDTDEGNAAGLPMWSTGKVIAD